MATQDKIRALTRRLYPKGRAFKMPIDGVLDRLHKALALSEARAYDASLTIFDSTIADNPNFTEDDATQWERRLGLAGGGTLADRIMGINQKLNYPGTEAPRQHWRFIEDQLRAAGFDVYVYENRFPGFNIDGTKTIVDVLAPFSDVGQHGDGQMGDFQHGTTTGVNTGYFRYVQHGDVQMGDVQTGQYEYYNKVANSMEESRDAFFIPGSTLRSTFFIGGVPLGTFATVPLSRRAAFRQLILSLKPQQTMAYLLVKYT